MFPNSAAAAAGVRIGDVVLSANGQRMDNREALHNFEGLQAVGSAVALELRRGAEPVTVNATLREQPRSFDGGVLDARLTGATFVELPERLRQGGLDGVLVSAVARGSRAAQNGLQKDDVVLAATSGEFNDLGGFRASFSQAPQRLVLRVLRGNQRGDLQMQ